ncbi:hypothetical protein ACS0TY_019909 [Phlomoides rotata]
MESYLQNFPNLGHSAESSDAKYVSRVSTILVANIQEAKDRISQIEYIFCSQLFPNFQLNSQSLQKIYSEAKIAAEDSYKEKEQDLLLQITKLQCQNQQVTEENQLLKLEKSKFIDMEIQSCNRLKEFQEELNQKTTEANERKDVHQNLQKLLESKSSLLHSYEKTTEELEEKNTMLLKKLKKLEVDTDDLKLELMKKSKEVDDIMELQNKLLQVNQSKSSLILEKEIQLKEHAEKTNGLISKLKNMENKVNELLSGLRDKTEEVENGKQLQENLLKKIEYQALEMMKNEQLLNKCEVENRHLSSKVTNLMKRVDELQNELSERTFELEKVRKEKERLLCRSDSSNFELIKKGQALNEFEDERKRLLYKQKDLGEKVNKLRQSLYERTKESSDGMELHGKLLQQIEVKDSELLSEKCKTKKVFAAYKQLKSQYNFLLKQHGLTHEPPLDKIEDENGTIIPDQTPVSSKDIENNTSKTSEIAYDVTKPVDEQEVLEDQKRVVLVQRTTLAPPPTSSLPIAQKCPSGSVTCTPAGAKRPSSYWRDTRSHQSRVGPDPHDDFLDTPLENVRENLGKVMRKDLPDIPKPATMKMSVDDSDDQTQDINADGGPQKQHKPSPKAGTSGFKYVEPVRKKSERENLKGVECKQCKKFYDAVLPSEGKNADTDKKSNRCEHHDGVSRHRYRYAPPSTPEGFWNIGFESEM